MWGLVRELKPGWSVRGESLIIVVWQKLCSFRRGEVSFGPRLCAFVRLGVRVRVSAPPLKGSVPRGRACVWASFGMTGWRSHLSISVLAHDG